MKICLIGEKLSHSYSAFIHKRFGYKYFTREVPFDEFEYFARRNDLDGFNVTVPYKEEIIKYLDELDDISKQVGSVNTVVNRNGKQIGYNTDVYGFGKLLDKNGIDVKGKRITILGSGGTRKTVEYVVRQRGASSVTVVSRSGEINYENCYDIETDILVNTTPVGMYPEVECSPIKLEKVKGVTTVIDVVYNPLKTELILQAERLKIKAVSGLAMLCYQAKASAELFTGERFSDEYIDKVYLELLNKTRNIVLIGMPSAGKTTNGKRLAQVLNKDFVDTDFLIKIKAKKQPSDILLTQGEEKLRELESLVIEEIGGVRGKIIATGGGSVLREQNVRILKRNGYFVYIKRKLENLSTRNRPLSQNGNLSKLFEERTPIYEALADVIIDGDKEDVVKKVTEIINENTCN